MKDGALLRVASIACVTIAYASYMLCSVAGGHEPEDGLLFGTVMLVLGALAGVDLRDMLKGDKDGNT